MVILTLESGILKNYIERSITFIRIGEISNVFVMFVIQPLFFLNGDPNFRQSHKIKWSSPADLKISQIFEKNVVSISIFVRIKYFMFYFEFREKLRCITTYLTYLGLLITYPFNWVSVSRSLDFMA